MDTNSHGCRKHRRTQIGQGNDWQENGDKEAGMWDEVVLMGRQGDEEISVHEVAQWKNSVSYDVLAGWRARLPRVYVGEG